MDPGTEAWRKVRPLVIAGVGLAAAAVLFGIPLGSLLVVGVALLCPLMMLRMHSGEHPHGDGSRIGRRADGADRSPE